jgi:hypothetical protein
MSRVVRYAKLAIVAFALTSQCARADDDGRPDATPYRPTVTTPAALSAPHWLEGEFGGQFSHDRSSDAGPPYRSSAPYALKYAFSEDWGIRVSGEGLVHVSGDGRHETGLGDTGFVVKRRFAVDEASAFGLEAGVLVPTARPALQLGSGKPDYSVNGIYSLDFAGWHSDLNVIETRMGSKQDAQSRWQTVGALALSHPLSDRWTAAGEFAGTRQHGTGSMTQFLASLAWAVRHDVVIDFGGIRGFNHATPTWQAFAGVTVVIGRID